MTDHAAAGASGEAEEIQRLRARITELEQQLKARRPDASGQETDHPQGEWAKTAAAALAAANVALAVPAFVTVRRWYRWWWR